MKKKNLFLRILLLLSIFFISNHVSAETTVIIKNINSADHKIELTNVTSSDIELSGWKIVQQNLPIEENSTTMDIDLSGVILASADKLFPVENFGVNGAVFYLYDQGNNLVMSATIALEEIPVISGVLPLSGSRVGSLTTLTFASSRFNDPGCQVDGLNWGSPCNGSTFIAIPGWGNVAEGPFVLTIRDTNSMGVEGRLDVNYIKDITAPKLIGATAIDEKTIEVLFNEELQTGLIATDFMISGAQGDNPIISASVDNSKVTLKLQNSFLNTDEIVLNINPFKPTSIKDIVGNEFDPIETILVVNNIAEVVVVEVPVVSEESGSVSSGGGGGGSVTTGYIPVVVEDPLLGQVLGTTIFKFTRNLSFGQKHPDILELQERLMKEGLMSPATSTDYFGPKTLAAVKLYQKNHKLPVVGYVGPMTRSVLNGWFVKNRPENNLASVNEQQLVMLQNLIKALIEKLKN